MVLSLLLESLHFRLLRREINDVSWAHSACHHHPKATFWISLYQPLYMAVPVSLWKSRVSPPKTVSYLAMLHRYAGMPQWCILLHLCTGLYSRLEQKRMCIVPGLNLSPVILEQLQRSKKVQSRFLLGFDATVSPSSWCFASQTELAIFYLLKPCINTAVANPHVCGKKKHRSHRS